MSIANLFTLDLLFLLSARDGELVLPVAPA